MEALHAEGSITAASHSHEDDASTIRAPQASQSNSVIVGGSYGVLQYTFEQDLKASRVYKRVLSRRKSISSCSSTALYTTALSVFSHLSLSKVSNISSYALPVYAIDISNSGHYCFGVVGPVVETTDVEQISEASAEETFKANQYWDEIMSRYRVDEPRHKSAPFLEKARYSVAPPTATADICYISALEDEKSVDSETEAAQEAGESSEAVDIDDSGLQIDGPCDCYQKESPFWLRLDTEGRRATPDSAPIYFFNPLLGVSTLGLPVGTFTGPTKS